MTTPEDGHTFRIEVRSRGSHGVTGQPGHTDAAEFDDDPLVVEVRAWSLVEALRRATVLPLAAWIRPEDDDDTATSRWPSVGH